MNVPILTVLNTAIWFSTAYMGWCRLRLMDITTPILIRLSVATFAACSTGQALSNFWPFSANHLFTDWSYFGIGVSLAIFMLADKRREWSKNR
jgi:hypothetical protein